MARVRAKTQALDPAYLAKLRELALRIPDDAARDDADLMAFARFYSFDCMRAGLRLRCPITRTSAGFSVFLEATTPRELREDTLAWLGARRG